MEWVWNKLVGFLRNNLLHLLSEKDRNEYLRFSLFNMYVYNFRGPLGCTLHMPNSNFSPNCKMLIKKLIVS